MSTLAEAREALADAVTAAGLTCLPYPPDAVDAPLAWVDEVGIDFTGTVGGGSFCIPGSASARIVTVAQRHDSQGARAYLEGLIPEIVKALDTLPGLRVLAADPDTQTVSQVDLPALNYLVQFPV